MYANCVAHVEYHSQATWLIGAPDRKLRWTGKHRQIMLSLSLGAAITSINAGAYGTVAGRDYLPEAYPGSEPRALARQRWHATATPPSQLILFNHGTNMAWGKSWIFLVGPFKLSYSMNSPPNEALQNGHSILASVNAANKTIWELIPPT